VSAQLQKEIASDRLPERYQIVRRLGSGGFGVVYEVVDKERELTIALKYLNAITPDALYRFKREFRSLADISHPNLVGLYDLAAHEGEWFFTMELLEGEAMPFALHPGGAFSALPLERQISGTSTRERADTEPPPPSEMPAVDYERVRRVFLQLAEGVNALHAAGCLHRDLKCSNVMVTADDRVVLLDFGLVGEVGAPASGLETVGGAIVGTPLYMAPEQCAGAPVDAAADWYAMGVMLYRALTGSFPFEGSTLEVLHSKQTKDAPALPTKEPVPADLERLCMKLLERSPRIRAGVEDVRELLGGGRGSLPALGIRADPRLVGRDEELGVLRKAFEESRGGRPITMLVEGISGVGKSALIRHFVRSIAGRRRTAVVLEGRCYAQESLPFKALDGVVDSLARYLLNLSDEAAPQLIPRHVVDLVQLFPVLRRVPAFADAAMQVTGIPDVQERQRRAFHGLRELLGKIADRHPLVIFVDDLQWGDAASAAVLRRILTGSDAPNLLLLGAYRREDEKKSAFLAELQTAESDLEIQHLAVEELAPARARELAVRLLDDEEHGDWADEIARESAGNPLFIDVLTRHANLFAQVVEPDGDEGPPPAPTRLADVIRATVGALPGEAQRLLELVSVSHRPLGPDVIRRALAIDALSPAIVGSLRSARLLRSRGTGSSEEIECYHDRIRETVVESLDDAELRVYHRRYADALVALESDDFEAMAIHFGAAGETDRAFGFAVRAGDRAVESLAFARAARLYRMALDFEVASEDERARLTVAMADAFRHAGLGASAAHAYLDAADVVARSDRRGALLLRHRAAEQLLFSGRLDEGKAVLDEVLSAVGLRMPHSPALALAAFAGRRAQAQLRGFDYRERPEAELDADVLLKIDVAWSVSIGLSMIDPVRAGSFQAHHLVMALDAGEKERIAKAVAVEVPFSATAGLKNRKRTARLEELAQSLAAEVEDPFVQALTKSCLGGAAWLEGRWRDAAEWQGKADELIRRECTGAAWQLATINIVMFDSFYRLGHWAELFERFHDVLDDAESRGDLFLEVYLRIKFKALAHLAHGDSSAARAELDGAIGRWSKGSFTLLQFWHLYLSCEADLYDGEAERALARLDGAWRDVKRSLLLNLQIYRVSAWDLKGRIELAVAARAAGRRSSHVSSARKAARKLRKENNPWADALGALIEAGGHALLDERADAFPRLREAEQAARSAHMSLHADLAGLRRAQLGRSSGDRDEAARAREAMEAQHIADADAWANVLSPGFHVNSGT
jgi:hypothetical protein